MEVIDVLINALLAFAILLNLYAFVRHERARRRLLARVDELHEAMGRLIGFAAWTSREVSGAPERVRDLARAALPAWLSVEIIEHAPEPPGDERVH